ncbi:MAG: hypothetical protein V3V78_03095 [Candidatus Woesearchaeota archaeon]
MAKKKASKVSDYVDLFSQAVAKYFSQKYKVVKKVEDVKKATIQTALNVKKQIMKTIIEATLLATGMIALVVGIILILNKVFPLEYILIAYGFIVVIGILANMKLKA